jgi:hypothetical protein
VGEVARLAEKLLHGENSLEEDAEYEAEPDPGDVCALSSVPRNVSNPNLLSSRSSSR